jgi:phage/plasmid-associated DNA primase
VAGYKRLEAQKRFSYNIDMKNTIAEVKIDNNPVLAFADECIEFNVNDCCILKSAMYQEYKRWVLDHGNKPLSFRKFNKVFFNAFKKKTTNDFLYGEGRERAWSMIKYKVSEMSIEHGERYVKKAEENINWDRDPSGERNE